MEGLGTLWNEGTLNVTKAGTIGENVSVRSNANMSWRLFAIKQD